MPSSAVTLLRDARVILVSIRDPRDAATSLMLYQGHSFAQAMERLAPSVAFCGGLAHDKRALLLRYEDHFTEERETVARLAAALGVPLADAAVTTIFAANERSAVERFVAGLDKNPDAHRYPGGAYDPQTQWHKHHFGRSGEVGRWRRILTASQAGSVEAAFAAWMDRFGYARSAPAPFRAAPYNITIGRFGIR